MSEKTKKGSAFGFQWHFSICHHSLNEAVQQELSPSPLEAVKSCLDLGLVRLVLVCLSSGNRGKVFQITMSLTVNAAR